MSRDQLSIRLLVTSGGTSDEVCFVQWTALHGRLQPCYTSRSVPVPAEPGCRE